MAKNIKEVQEINRMILDEVDRVCKKYNICYYLDCGALLGAVRHGSFIPWDDDVDIRFTRMTRQISIHMKRSERRQPEIFGENLH